MPMGAFCNVAVVVKAGSQPAGAEGTTAIEVITGLSLQLTQLANFNYKGFLGIKNKSVSAWLLNHAVPIRFSNRSVSYQCAP